MTTLEKAKSAYFSKGDPFKRHKKKKRKSTPTSPYTEAITEGLSDREYSMKRRKGRIFGSDGIVCPRKTVLLHHVEKHQKSKTSAASRLYFKMGDGMQEVLGVGLENAGMLVFEEWKIDDSEVSIGERIDWIVIKDGKLRGIEAKTCNKLPNEAKSAHVFQARTYQLMTGLPFDVLYASRNVADFHGNLKIASFELEWNEEIEWDTAERMATIHVYDKHNLLPDIPSNKTSASACSWCPFKSRCWDGEVTYTMDIEFDLVSPERKAELDAEIHEFAEFLINGTDNRRDALIKQLANGEGGNGLRKNWIKLRDADSLEQFV